MVAQFQPLQAQPLQTILRYAICTLLLAIGIRTWLVMGLIAPVTVAGSSMKPTLKSGERLWIDRSAFQWRSPRRWEVVVARNPTEGCELCVKRVVGLPGEQVTVDNGQLLIDGESIVRNSRHQPPPEASRAPLPWKSRQWQLAEDEYFLLGDNASISVDSRHWGPVPGRLLLGKPLGVR